jgi:sulfur-oxidizing protein SoxZ
MATDIKPRVRMPQAIKKGDVIEIKTLVSHPMESGQRKDAEGKPIPRKIINAMAARFNGKEFFSAKLEPAIAVNPYLAFSLRVADSGTLELSWTDDDGSVYKSEHKISISG